MKRFEMKLPEDMHEKLRKLAFDRESSIAEEVRKAVEEYLRKEDKHGEN